MKFKRLLAVILVAVMCFSLTFCVKADPSESGGNETTEVVDKQESETSDEESKKTETDETKKEEPEEKEPAEITPLLYKVTDDKGGVVWLFGSIHVGREDYYPLPDYVTKAFDGSDALAVEADILTFEEDLSLQVKALTHLMYRDGTTISDHIPEELCDKATEILKEYGFYSFALKQYKPAMWSSTIESLMYEECGADTNLGIDRHLMQRALDAEKEIYEIESAEFQYKMLGNFSNELQIMMLEEAVEATDDLEALKKDVSELMDLWASGNEEEFHRYLYTDTSAIPDEEILLYEEYNNEMLVKRNLSMTDYAEEALLSGEEIFICVGAAHVVGEGAISDLMEQRGYTVEVIKSN